MAADADWRLLVVENSTTMMSRVTRGIAAGAVGATIGGLGPRRWSWGLENPPTLRRCRLASRRSGLHPKTDRYSSAKKSSFELYAS